MSKARLTAPATSDVDDLLAYYAAHSRKYALKLASAFRRTFRVVGRKPKCGRPTTFRPFGLRQIAVMKHVVFFRDTPTGVEIIRVLDGRRLIDDSLFHTP